MKKIFSLFAIFCLMVVCFSSCTLAGVPSSVVGTWKQDSSDSYFGKYLRITNNDEVLSGSSTNNLVKVGKIKKASCAEMEIDFLGGLGSKTYQYNLIGEVLILDLDRGTSYSFVKEGGCFDTLGSLVDALD